MSPRFSVVTPVYDTPADILRATIASVTDQSFTDWELCLVDDASPSEHVETVLAEAATDPRIRVAHRETNGGIVAASNDGLAMADGEFVALLDHDDVLHPDALAEVDRALHAEPDADYVYTDEDKIDERGRRSAPFLKPDWSPERFRTQMYSCHLSVLRRSLVDEVGGFQSEFEGAQDWDLVLRVTERAQAVVHVPKVLYHWRTLATSTAGSGEAAKPYAYEAGTRAIQAHCDRIGFPARASHDEERSGVYHLRPELKDHPPVSIVIPTRGGRRVVRGGDEVCLASHCVQSIVEQTTYPHYQLVVVADAETPEGLLRNLRKQADGRLRVVRYIEPFNFSDKINRGVLASDGDHVVMLNDDMEVVTQDWLSRMVMYSQHPGIGAVGAKLLFGDGRLQHVGVRVHKAMPGHLFRGFAPDFDGYGNIVRVANNFQAVTGACLMTPRELFDEVGGLSLLFPLSFNDVDYCLKVRSLGQRVVYDPDTVLFHFESSSRSSEVSDWELSRLQDRWRHATMVDPYDNPNFHPSSVNMVPPVYHADGSVLV